MSSAAIKPQHDLDWKQEVNQRVAAHKSRRDSSVRSRPAGASPHLAANSVAAQAAARVAARYAQAPTYSQMLAEEARAAVRAAEAASEAALKMQAAAESVLAELESVVVPEPPHPASAEVRADLQTAESFFDSFLEVERPVAAAEKRLDAGELKIRWEPDMPVRQAQPMPSLLPVRPEQISLTLDEWRGARGYGEPETVEPAQPIPGNLIEFPRELIAARKARPRIAEGPLASESGETGQLSIFEVDPGTISIQPAPADTTVEEPTAGWSKLFLDKETAQDPVAEPAPATNMHPILSAPLHLRLLAAVVDGAVVGAVFCAVALAAAAILNSQPSMRAMELVGGAVLLSIWLLYHGLFLVYTGMTPGMRYAGVTLCNFEDEQPSRRQKRLRVGAMMLSILPVGLGVVWSLFDDDHLTWHDRISHTYVR